jgi:hypothetical protein
LRQRRVKSLHRSQGFTQLRAESRSGFAQRIEHIFLARRRGLLLGQHVTAKTVCRLKAHDVLAANISDGAGEVSLAVGTLA